MNKYTVVSFYTVNTPYEIEILHMENSCDKFNLKHDIEGIQSLGTWLKNINYKPSYIYKKWKEHRTPIVWVDGDGVIKNDPVLFNDIEEDIGIHIIHHPNGRHEWFASVVYVNQTERAEYCLQRWIEVLDQTPNKMDQEVLQSISEDLIVNHGVRVKRLPQTYAKIFDWNAPLETSDPIVIEQYQASRRFKRIINGEQQ